MNTKEPIAVVGSDSMNPALKKGDVVIIKGIDKETYIRQGSIEEKDGDIIAFDAKDLWEDAPEDPIIHRIVDKWYDESKEMWYFLTKGDANDQVDKVPIPKDHVI
ncbi:MAG: signal peptidase I, partial [Promethearchaeota archaeon]